MPSELSGRNGLSIKEVWGGPDHRRGMILSIVGGGGRGGGALPLLQVRALIRLYPSVLCDMTATPAGSQQEQGREQFLALLHRG